MNVKKKILSSAHAGAEVQVKKLEKSFERMDTANDLQLKVIRDPGAVKAASQLFQYCCDEGDMSNIARFYIALDRLLMNLGARPQEVESENSEPPKKVDVQPRTPKEEAEVEDDELWRA